MSRKQTQTNVVIDEMATPWVLYFHKVLGIFMTQGTEVNAEQADVKSSHQCL